MTEQQLIYLAVIATYSLGALLVLLLLLLFRKNIFILSHWSHGFDGLQFSSQEFYQSVQKSLETRQVPELSFSRVRHLMKLRTVVFDKRREYLCATRGEYQFQICAAPFGTGFFVSWWFLERERKYKTLLKRIPILRLLFSIKTFHQIDSEEMYRSFVHMCVLEAIDTMTTSKGVRLTEYERRIGKSKD